MIKVHSINNLICLPIQLAQYEYHFSVHHNNNRKNDEIYFKLLFFPSTIFTLLNESPRCMTTGNR